MNKDNTERRKEIIKCLIGLGVRHINADLEKMTVEELEELVAIVEKDLRSRK